MSANVFRYPHDWEPRWYQKAGMRFFDGGGRFAISVHHRRAGKDLTALVQTCKKMLERVGAYWHVFPTAEQGRKAVWTEFTKDSRRIMDLVFPSAIRKTPRDFTPNGEMVVELKNGSIWRLIGSDKMEVVGAGPVGVVFSEYAQARPNTWDLVRPMLREREGWAWFISTPRGRNHLWELVEMARKNPDWFVDVKSLRDTRAYDPEKTLAEERASGMPEDLIKQEYLCDWNAANPGSYYGELMAAVRARGGVCVFRHNGRQVFTTWDLGRSDNTSIWWWEVSEGRDSVDVLDHYSSSGKDLEHYFDVVEDRARRLGFHYQRHWLPHDARARTLGTKATIEEQARGRLGSQRVGIVPQLGLEEGIQSARRLLLTPVRFHERCARSRKSPNPGPFESELDGLACLEAYHRAWSDERKVYALLPVHDWSSHTADAWRYTGVVFEYSEDRTRPAPKRELRPAIPTVAEAMANLPSKPRDTRL